MIFERLCLNADKSSNPFHFVQLADKLPPDLWIRLMNIYQTFSVCPETVLGGTVLTMTPAKPSPLLELTFWSQEAIYKPGKIKALDNAFDGKRCCVQDKAGRGRCVWGRDAVFQAQGKEGLPGKGGI